MRFKEGVRLHGIRPEMVAAFPAIEAARRIIDDQEATITSACDGKHSEKSKHYIGCAVDVRTRDLGASWQTFAVEIRERIPTDFDVVVESDHLHIEWDPVGKP